jgi:hypothetical protein
MPYWAKAGAAGAARARHKAAAVNLRMSWNPFPVEGGDLNRGYPAVNGAL